MPTVFPQPRFAHKAESYNAHATVQLEAANWLAEWLPNVSGSARVLELGAGTGLYTRQLFQQFTDLTSTDLSPEMLRVSQERIPGPEYTVQDAWNPLLSPGTWDLVTASSLLQWATDPIRTLEHWTHALKEDGRILTAFFIDPTLTELETVIGEPGPVQWRDASTWQKIFDRVGLQTLRMETKTQRYNFSSAIDLWKALHGTGATVSRQLKPSALIRFFRDYEEQFSDASGIYSTWTTCRVELNRA
ncbi:MAG: class I SAM-dependent methyltransferase [Coraliomargaritaceae bacterium]